MDDEAPEVTEQVRTMAEGQATPEPEVDPEDQAPPEEITYDEQLYPARPRRLRPRANLRGGSIRRTFSDPRAANGQNPAYVEWLVRQSMLKDADVLSRQLSGSPSMWRNPYARPDARRAAPLRARQSLAARAFRPGRASLERGCGKALFYRFYGRCVLISTTL